MRGGYNDQCFGSCDDGWISEVGLHRECHGRNRIDKDRVEMAQLSTTCRVSSVKKCVGRVICHARGV
jgi:hypothetical protein